MTFNTTVFMCRNSTSNNFEYDENNPNSEESDYNNLSTRLQEIKKTIALMEKIIFKEI